MTRRRRARHITSSLRTLREANYMSSRITKIADDLNSNDAEALPAAGPVRLRRAKRPKTVVRARKSRRKAHAPGGIHQRSNKRANW